MLFRSEGQEISGFRSRKKTDLHSAQALKQDDHGSFTGGLFFCKLGKLYTDIRPFIIGFIFYLICMVDDE